MSVFMIVQAIRTGLESHRRLKAVKFDGITNYYEDYEPAALIAEVIPAAFVIKKDDFKHRVKCDDLYRMSCEAAKC